MQVTFTRWSITPTSRTPISLDPARVDATEFYSGAFTSPAQEAFPAATKIIMKNKQEYIVQGQHDEVVKKLNGGEQS